VGFGSNAAAVWIGQRYEQRRWLRDQRLQAYNEVARAGRALDESLSRLVVARRVNPGSLAISEGRAIARLAADADALMHALPRVELVGSKDLESGKDFELYGIASALHDLASAPCFDEAEFMEWHEAHDSELLELVNDFMVRARRELCTRGVPPVS
jgi:hypothetical protein